MSTVHNGHPIVSQLHLPITANDNGFQLDIPAHAFISQPAATSKVLAGAHSNERKSDVHVVSELQKCLVEQQM